MDDLPMLNTPELRAAAGMLPNVGFHCKARQFFTPEEITAMDIGPDDGVHILPTPVPCDHDFGDDSDYDTGRCSKCGMSMIAMSFMDYDGF